MENTQNEKSQKGFLSKLWKAHSTTAKYLGLFGIPLIFGFLPKAAFNAHAADPTAGLTDSVGALWSMMGSLVKEYMVPGWLVILGQVGHMATDVILPGAGIVTSLAINTISGGAGTSPVNHPFPSGP